MKKFLKFSLILALAIFTFSCSNDNTDVIPEEESTVVNATLKANLTTYARTATTTNQAENVFENNNENSDSIDSCFTLNYPYTVTNGTDNVVVNNDQEAEAYANLGYMPAFPLTITMADGNVVTVADEFELFQVLEDCIGGDIDPIGNDCFEFNFPLTVETIDGATVVVNDEFELFSVEDAIGFAYPITVTVGNDIVTINSDADFDALYNDCYDIEPCDDCGTICFEIVFPLTLVDDSGNVTTVNDEDEFFTYLDGLADDAFFTITYPMTIEYEDGTQATINSDDELTAAFDACN
ncbi:hypothetical protein U8527_02445 [Kordia algicida OT-1]|uniref:Uncharacterized protein n=1 Tax=Kordia algicida OT-1 TaxID=391587 RepID=A9DNE3_9FLAO|nr:hypothetical protein [Kordia algicida]EDP97170.1 hypothetical protein KAOT1_18447 [Kordia algicida OT-1]